MYNTTIKSKKCVNNLDIEKRSCNLTPWQEAPYQLISWWDMQQFSAKKFYNMTLMLERIRKEPYIKYQEPTNLDISEESKIKLEKLLRPIEDFCIELSLENSAEVIKEFRNYLLAWKTLKFANLPLSEIDARLGEIHRSIFRETKLHLFMYIRADKAKYYDSYRKTRVGLANPSGFLFGDSVNNKFPSAGFDITEAGNCFATNRYTACVFHLMRVMEIAVQKLGDNLGVTVANEKVWQKIIENIRTELNTKFPNSKDSNRIKYENILGHLETVKIAWRNPTMHPKATYIEEEADDIMHTVKIL